VGITHRESVGDASPSARQSCTFELSQCTV